MLKVPNGQNITVDNIYPSRTCNICQNNKPNTLMATQNNKSCGHMGCRRCIERLRDYQLSCPSCRMPFTRIAHLTDSGNIEVVLISTTSFIRQSGISLGGQMYDNMSDYDDQTPVMARRSYGNMSDGDQTLSAVRQSAAYNYQTPMSRQPPPVSRQPASVSCQTTLSRPAPVSQPAPVSLHPLYRQSRTVIPAVSLSSYHFPTIREEGDTVNDETTALIVYNSNIHLGSLVISTNNDRQRSTGSIRVVNMVIDISGSMSGPNLADTQKGLCEIAKNLKGDTNTLLTIVTFSDTVYYRYPASFVTSENISDIFNTINGFVASGSTHLSTAFDSIMPILEDIVAQLASAGHSFTVQDLDVTLVLATDGEPTTGFDPDEECLGRINFLKKVFFFTIGNNIKASTLYGNMVRALGEERLVYKPCSTPDDIIGMAESVQPYNGCLYTSLSVEMTNATNGITDTPMVVTRSGVEFAAILILPFQCSDDISNTTCSITATLPTGETINILPQHIGSNVGLESEGISKIILGRCADATTPEQLDRLIAILDSADCIYSNDLELRTAIATKRANLLAQLSRPANVVVPTPTNAQINENLKLKNRATSSSTSSRSASVDIAIMVRQFSGSNSGDSTADDSTAPNDWTPTLDRVDDENADKDVDVDADVGADIGADVGADASAGADASV
jgi:uncharacterized protein YegL